MSVTPEGRASYANVFEAQKNDLNGDMEYSMVAIFEPSANLSSMKVDAELALVQKWGADKAKWPQNLRHPFRKCKERWKMVDGKQVIPAGYENGDAVFITFKKKAKNGRPSVVDQNVQDIIEPSQFYSGCYVKVSYNAYAYDQKGNRGVSFGLNNVQKIRDGEPLGGRARASDEFTAVAGAATETKGAGGIFDD